MSEGIGGGVYGKAPFGGPGGGGIIAAFTFATLPVTYAVGQPVWVSDIGRAVIGASPVAATGSLWVFNGTIWVPVGGRVLLAKLGASITGLTNVEAVSGQLLLPAAFLKLADRLEWVFGLSKSGGTDTGGARARIGTAGLVSDTAVLAGTLLSATQLHGGTTYLQRIETATTIQMLSRSDIGMGGGTTAAIPGATTISNISNALYLNVGAVSGGASNTVGLTEAEIWLVR